VGDSAVGIPQDKSAQLHTNAVRAELGVGPPCAKKSAASKRGEGERISVGPPHRISQFHGDRVVEKPFGYGTS